MTFPFHSDEKVDFVIVTALQEELNAILGRLPGHQKLPPSEGDIRTYYRADLPVRFSDNAVGKYRIVVTYLLGMGRLQAAAATADVLRRWQPRYILLVGIAGGISTQKVRIGDILISDQIVDYELQKLTPQEPEIRWEVHRADPRLLNASITFADEEWQKTTRTTRPDEEKPTCHRGPIASGDKVIAFGEILAKYRDMWPKLIGVEMEAAGVATTAFQSPAKPGFFMVRGVSDLADENKDSADVGKWRRYASDIAASFVISFLESGPVTLAETRQVEIILNGEFNEFNSIKRQDLIRVIAALLIIDQNDIRILEVRPGSIRIVLEIPISAANHLYEMASVHDPRIMSLGIKLISIEGRESIRLVNKNAMHSDKWADRLRKTMNVEFTKAQTTLLRELWHEPNETARHQLLSTHPSEVNEALALLIIGLANEAGSSGDFATAWTWMEISKLIVQNLNEPKLVADHLSQQGSLDFNRGMLHQALEAWERALPLYEPLGASEELAACLTNLGIGYHHTGTLSRASECLTRAIEIYRQIGRPDGEIASLNVQAMIVFEAGDSDTARQQLEAALNIARTHQDQRHEAQILGHLGVVYRHQSDSLRAIEYLERALALQQELNDERGEASQWVNLGVVRRDMGETSRALKCFEQAREKFRTLGDRRGEASVLSDLAIIYHAQGEYDRALTLHQQALDIDREVGYRLGEASDLGNLALVYWDLEQWDHVADYLQGAITIHRQLGDLRGVANDMTHFGLLARRQKRWDEAIQSLEEARALHQQLGFRQGESGDWGNLGLVYQERGEWEKALEANEQALAIDRTIGYRLGEASELNRIANLRAERGEIERAIGMQTEALNIARQLVNRDLELRILASRAQAYRQAQAWSQAAADYRVAAGLIETVRGGFSDPRDKIAFTSDTRLIIFVQLVLLTAQHLKQIIDAWEWVERAKTRAFLDQLGSRVSIIPRGVRPGWIEREQQISANLAANEAALRAIQSEEERRRLLERVNSLKVENVKLLSSLETVDPDYVELRRGKPITFGQLLGLLRT